MRDLDYFDDMIIDCYTIFAGSRKTIKTTKKIFKEQGIRLNNVIFYEIKEKIAKNHLIKIDNRKLKIQILESLYIL